MASREHSWIVARSLVLQKASYELQIPKSATSILFFSLSLSIDKRFVLVSNEKLLLMHIKNTRIWIFCLFPTEKHNVYNIYVAINVPSFFKLNCMCIYFSHWANTFVSVTAPYLLFLLSIKFYFMKRQRKDEVGWAQKHGGSFRLSYNTFLQWI